MSPTCEMVYQRENKEVDLIEFHPHHLHCSTNAVVWLKEGGKEIGDCHVPKDCVLLVFFDFSRNSLSGFSLAKVTKPIVLNIHLPMYLCHGS
jgi:hypothetical protein